MTQTPEQKENTPKNKRFPFFSLLLAILIVAAVIGAAYIAIFPNQKIEIPFVSKETEQRINSFIANPRTAFQNTETDSQAPVSADNKENKRSNYQTANEILEKLTSAGPAAETPVSENNGQDLNVVDMTPKQENSDSLQTGSDEFSLQPPDTVPPLQSGRRMLTEEEIKEAQERDRREKLAKLEALRNQNTILSDEEINALPSHEGTLSDVVPEPIFDPVVTVFFIQDLAEYLVNSYKTAADGQNSAAVSMPKLNQRYGVGLYGLEHAAGRLGVLKYAYNESMMPKLYSHLSPQLIKAMLLTALQKNMSAAAQKAMFENYAVLCRQYADAIRELNAIPQLAENFQNLHAIEDSLKEEEQYFAENLLAFEQNRENKDLARTFEENIKQSTIRTEQLRLRVNKVKTDLKKYLADYNENLAAVPDILELALWLNRRNNPAANQAFADILEQFAGDINTLLYE